MNTTSHILLRMAVVVGGVTLLAGLAGGVMLALRPDIRIAPVEPTSPSHVRVRGASAEEAGGVEVQWTKGNTLVTQAARRGETTGVWILPPVPDGQMITLRVRRGEGGRVIHEVQYKGGLAPPIEVVIDAEDDSEDGEGGK